MSETSEYQIVAATPPPQTLTLLQAVEVLNRVGHLEARDWQQHGIHSATCHSRAGVLNALEALAVAEFYLRHGITAWPGWEWKG